MSCVRIIKYHNQAQSVQDGECDRMKIPDYKYYKFKVRKRVLTTIENGFIMAREGHVKSDL